METIDQIEAAVARLSPEEFARFREWFLAYDAEVWDREIEEDAAAGRLDGLAAEALAEYRAGKTRPL